MEKTHPKINALHGVVPLVLHRIVHGSATEWEDVHEDQLRRILAYVSSTTTTTTLCQNVPRNDARFLITFDDGYASDYEIVFPLLCEKKLTATFFIVTDLVGQSGYLNWEQINEMHKYGMCFGSHSVSHNRMSDLAQEVVMREFIDSKLILEDQLGAAINAFSYPYGVCNTQLHKVGISAGYEYLCTSEHGIINSDSSVLPRNSIHSGLNDKLLMKVLVSNKSTLFRWTIEDMVKEALKQILGKQRYIKLRNKILQ